MLIRSGGTAVGARSAARSSLIRLIPHSYIPIRLMISRYAPSRSGAGARLGGGDAGDEQTVRHGDDLPLRGRS